MAAKSQNSKVYPLPIQCFVLELRSPPIREFMNIKWVAEDVLPNNALHYQYQHGVTMTSWGETIDIWLTALGERATQVDIRSECYLPTQIIDWGAAAPRLPARPGRRLLFPVWPDGRQFHW